MPHLLLSFFGEGSWESGGFWSQRALVDTDGLDLWQPGHLQWSFSWTMDGLVGGGEGKEWLRFILLDLSAAFDTVNHHSGQLARVGKWICGWEIEIQIQSKQDGEAVSCKALCFQDCITSHGAVIPQQRPFGVTALAKIVLKLMGREIFAQPWLVYQVHSCLSLD